MKEKNVVCDCTIVISVIVVLLVSSSEKYYFLFLLCICFLIYSFFFCRDFQCACSPGFYGKTCTEVRERENYHKLSYYSSIFDYLSFFLYLFQLSISTNTYVFLFVFSLDSVALVLKGEFTNFH